MKRKKYSVSVNVGDLLSVIVGARNRSVVALDRQSPGLFEGQRLQRKNEERKEKEKEKTCQQTEVI